MAALTDNERAELTADFQRNPINVGSGAGGLTKAQLRAALNATDDWADSNAAEFNLALPVAARSAMSTQQKTLMLAAVILKRAGLL